VALAGPRDGVGDLLDAVFGKELPAVGGVSTRDQSYGVKV
jgi:hypothetical protein